MPARFGFESGASPLSCGHKSSLLLAPDRIKVACILFRTNVSDSNHVADWKARNLHEVPITMGERISRFAW
ncbi:hypothetical protein QR680_003135 [Steinernema hermaphroditum]|uniref:Uncharacterized protein n=1 Tax=Steinernema hermaphroditum TaxID=289476 RepID=A0AA39H7P5_9BILA|nr:hypothetical protein QR680_003135 [Steinernema hermaphroditum]